MRRSRPQAQRISTPGDGDFVHITGTTTITSFGTAPQAGATRTLIFDGALTLTHNATTLKLPGGASITTAANDRCVVRADTTANMIVTDYTKADGTAVVVAASGGATVATAIATTSGTTAQFTGISSSAKELTLTFSGVSTNGTSSFLVQIGPSGGVETSGYSGMCLRINYTPATNWESNSTGFGIRYENASQVYHGSVVLTLVDASTNTWAMQGVFGETNGVTGNGYVAMVGGSKSLAGTLERIRLTTISGDTFDAGKLGLVVKS